ncbi:MAG: P1 family peptidase [Tissierellia bacterium]|nr:P1 family peptidase [Tissierellia bacterium]
MTYWYFNKGEKNSICDVEGIKVGHITKAKGSIQTGVTIINPSPKNIFRHKLIGASHVINGFGKPVGLIQVNELGTLETPIVLTNTLAIGTATQSLIDIMVKENEEIGADGTVNPIVLECNDGELNDIRTLHIEKEDVKKALDNARTEFQQGAVGGGRGMVCYDLKGGIGSSSRIIPLGDKEYTIGVLVMSNFGSMKDLMFQDQRLGPTLVEMTKIEDREDKGSIIVVIATDAPLSHRQLKRIAKRSQSGIARTGGYTGNGSGEITLAFSTAQSIPSEKIEILDLKFLHDSTMDLFFQGTVEATEEAILQSLLHGEKVLGHKGKVISALKDFFPDLSLK